MSDELEPWEEKVHRIISALSMEAFNLANRLPNGRLRKKHVPYRIPDSAERLVECLGMKDRSAAEETAKAIFLYDYDISKLNQVR